MEAQRIKALKISDIDEKKITLLVTAKKTNKVPITYGQDPFAFQTPFLEVTDKLRPTAYQHIHQLDTLFKGDSKSKIDQFYQFIEALESNVCAQIGKNCAKWFSQKDITFKSLIRESDLNKNMFYIKWPIEMKENMFITENGKQFNPKNLKEKDYVKFIVEIPNIWIDGERIGLACIVQKIMVKSYQEKITSEYIFDTNSSSSEDDLSVNIVSILNDDVSTKSKKIQSPAPKNARIPEIETQTEPLRSKKIVQTKPILSDKPKNNLTALFTDPSNEFELLSDEPVVVKKNNAAQSLKVELVSHKKFQQQKNKHVITSDEELSDASTD